MLRPSDPMFRRNPNRPRDPNQPAHQIVQESVGDADKIPVPVRMSGRRAGTLKGGRVHADSRTPGPRSEITGKAARAPWAVDQ